MPPLPHNYQARFDTAESIFVNRALQWIEKETYNTELPPIEGRRFVPTDNSAPPGAKYTSYKRYTRTGIARLITEKGKDIPVVGMFVQEYIHEFYAVGAAYQYDYLDLLAAAMAAENGGPPINLDLEGSLGAREAIERKLDVIAAFGSKDAGTWALEVEFDVGLVGLINIPGATNYSIATGVGGLTTWVSKTPDEVLADLVGIKAAMIATTYKVHKPTSILAPVQHGESIMGRSMGDGRAETILSYFLRTQRESGSPMEFDTWNYLENAFTSGTADGMICYNKNRRYVRHAINMEFQALPAQLRDMTYKVACLAKTAGVISPYPLSVSYGIGI